MHSPSSCAVFCKFAARFELLQRLALSTLSTPTSCVPRPLGPETLGAFVRDTTESILTGCFPAWYRKRTAQRHRALQCGRLRGSADVMFPPSRTRTRPEAPQNHQGPPAVPNTNCWSCSLSGKRYRSLGPKPREEEEQLFPPKRSGSWGNPPPTNQPHARDYFNTYLL